MGPSDASSRGVWGDVAQEKYLGRFSPSSPGDLSVLK